MENLKKYYKFAYTLFILALGQASVTATAVTSFSVEYYLPMASSFTPTGGYSTAGQMCTGAFAILGYGGNYISNGYFTTNLAVNNAPAGQSCTFPQQIGWTYVPWGNCLPGTGMSTSAPVLTSSPSTTPTLIFQTNSGGTQNVSLDTSQLCKTSNYNGENLQFQGCQIDPLTPAWLWCCYSTGTAQDCFNAQAVARGMR